VPEVAREGKVTYDIRFYILTPDEKHVKIIMKPEEKKRILREEFEKLLIES